MSLVSFLAGRGDELSETSQGYSLGKGPSCLMIVRGEND
jgi:hypothetical protein